MSMDKYLPNYDYAEKDAIRTNQTTNVVVGQ